MRKQCVPGAPLFFVCTRDQATFHPNSPGVFVTAGAVGESTGHCWLQKMATTTAEIICWIAAVCTSLNSAAITLASVLLWVCLFPLMPDDVLSPDATMQWLLSEACTKIAWLQCWCTRTRAEPIILFQISTYYSSIFDQLFSHYSCCNTISKQ